jgi:hypothetical protein
VEGLWGDPATKNFSGKGSSSFIKAAYHDLVIVFDKNLASSGKIDIMNFVRA